VSDRKRTKSSVLSFAPPESRRVPRLLFDVTARDPLMLGLATVTLLAVAGLASYLPARAAAGVDPMQGLREG
jgi:hypothetical protein